METLARYLSTTLKQLRQQRGWSLSRLAEATGVTNAMLGQNERNESSPRFVQWWLRRQSLLARLLPLNWRSQLIPPETPQVAWAEE